MILLVTTPRAVVLPVCIGVGGCLCPIIFNAWSAGIDYCQLMNRAPRSASEAEEMTTLMIWEILITSPLFDGMAASSDMKIFYLLVFLLLFMRGKRYQCVRQAPCQKRGM